MTDISPATARLTYLTLSKAAARLGLSIDTVRRWFDEGRLTGIRLPDGRRMVDPASLEAVHRPLTVSEAAAELDRSVDTVRHLFDEGSLKGYRSPGGHRYIDPASVAVLKGEK